ncbi:hypothetical protein SEVIR_1G248001v4 [Setaria viridis]|nr:uncharacterized protein LOC117846549 [Setaria viridis]
MQDAEVIQGLADAAGSLEPTGLAAVSRRNDKWEAEGPLPTPLLPPPTGAAIYGEQGEGCMAADCSTPGSGPAPAKGAWHSVLLLPIHLVKPETSNCYTGCDYISAWSHITQSCGQFLLNQSDDPTDECRAICQALSSEGLLCACSTCPAYVHRFNISRFLDLANRIDPRFGTPLCCECDGVPASLPFSREN